MKRNVKLLALFNFFTDFSFYSAILVIYFAKVTGSFTLAMSLFAVTMISSALFELPTGLFSDLIGRKKTMVLGAICAILANTFYAVGISYWFLFIGALFEGMQRAWYSGNNDALLHDTLSSLGKKHLYDEYLGKLSSMFQIASAIAIILGGLMATWSFSVVMWLSVVPAFICFIIAVMVKEPQVYEKSSGNIFSHLKLSAFSLWKNPKLRLLSINSVLSFAVGESTYQFRSAFINTLWPLWAVGISKVLSSIGAAISYWFSSWVIKKLGAFRLLFLSNVYSKFVNIVSVGWVTILSPVLLATTSVFYGSTSVAKSALMQKEFTDQQRATMGSLNSFLGNLFFGLAAILLGYCADKLGARWALMIAYVATLPTVWINWYLFKKYEKKV